MIRTFCSYKNIENFVWKFFFDPVVYEWKKQGAEKFTDGISKCHPLFM